MFSRETCQICWDTFFEEPHRMTVSDCSSINSSEGRIGKQYRKLLKKTAQVKEQVSKVVVRRLQIRCSKKFRKFYKKKSVLESHFNKVARLKLCNSIKKRLQYSRFPVKIANLLRTPFLQNRFSGYSFSKESRTKTGVTVSNKYHIELQKSICCHKNSEVASVNVLQKKVCNYIIGKRLQYYTYLEKHL